MNVLSSGLRLRPSGRDRQRWCRHSSTKSDDWEQSRGTICRRTGGSRRTTTDNSVGRRTMEATELAAPSQVSVLAAHHTFISRIPEAKNVQSAWLLLLHCASARACYLTRVVRDP